jgi:cellulose synthase/poly-beta-1,6-N-acetylglucosamine synthase-like glycosyltransferase
VASAPPRIGIWASIRAFGLFRRDLLVEIGGMDPRSLAEDTERVVGLQEHLRRQGRPHRRVFVPEPVCWTEVPESWKVLGRQRRRWSHGLGQLVWKHKRMIGNPRFGAIGLIAPASCSSSYSGRSSRSSD